MTEACRTLDELEAEYEAISRRLGEATWYSYAGAPEGTTAEDPAAVRAEFGPLLERAEALALDCSAAWLAGDPTAARRAEVWLLAARAWKLDADPEAVRLRTDLETRVNEFAFERDGTRYSRSDLSRMARSDDPAQRRLAFELRGDLHRAVLDDTMKLVAIRKAAAQALAGETYAETLLDAYGVPPAMLDPLLVELDARTKDAWDDVLRRAKEAAGDPGMTPAPWDLPWLLEKPGTVPDERWPKERALPALTATLAGIGIDLAALPIRRVEGDFGYGGQTLAVSIPDDVRMMLNPLPGSRTWGILFHETGHALQGVSTTVASPVLKGYEWLAGASVPAYSEGMAQLLGQLLGDRAFLERRTDLSAEEIDLFLASWRARSLQGLRAGLAATAFERALYEDGVDPDAESRETTERFLGVAVPADAPPSWAGTAFLAAYPCYMQNYVVADLVAAQILRAVRDRFGDDWMNDPAVGPWLAQTLWADGETRPWTDRVRDATGADLSADAYLELLGIPPG